MVKSSRSLTTTIASKARSLFFLVSMTALAPSAVHAGPCTADIDSLQATVDAKIDATAGIGRMGRESTAATDHRQPTPGSIARAEESLGEGGSYDQVLAALNQARTADQAGEAGACQRALAAAREAMGR